MLNIKRLIVALVITAAIILMTHLPPGSMPIKFAMKGSDKLAHLLAYGLITGLFIRSLRTLPSVVMICVLLLGVAALGAVDELTQPLVNRTACMRDWTADLAGIILAVLIFGWASHAKQENTDHVGG
jgi:hypothetical protein